MLHLQLTKTKTKMTKKILLLFIVSFFMMSCNDDDDNSAPANFQITSSDITANSAVLNWTIATDPDGDSVTYSVFLNENLIASNLSETTFNLIGLAEATDYVLIIAATDGNNNTTSEITFSTLDNLGPQNFDVTVSEITTTSAVLNWEEAVDPEGDIINYAIQLNNDVVIENLTETTYSLEGLDDNTEYSIAIIASDQNNEPTISTISFLTLENFGPQNFDVTVSEITTNSATINWEDAIDLEGDSVSYSIQLNDLLIAENLSETMFNLSDLDDNTEYSISIIASDENNNPTISMNSFMTLDNIAPSTFVLEFSNITINSANLSWSQAMDMEGDAVSYTITLNQEIVAENISELTYELANLDEKTNYTVAVSASDNLNTPTVSNEVEFETLETNLPPGEFQIEVSEITQNSAKINWTNPNDPNGPDTVSYDIFLNDVLVTENLRILTEEGEALETTLAGLTLSTSYNIKIVASDSEFSSEAINTFTTVSNPPDNFIVKIGDGSVTESGVLFDWPNVMDPDGDEVVYDIYVNGIEEAIGRTFSISTLRDLQPNTSYTIKVVARDSTGAKTESEASFVTLPIDGAFSVSVVNIENGFFGPTVFITSTDSFAVQSVLLDGIEFVNLVPSSPTTLNFAITQAQYDTLFNSSQNNGEIWYDDGGVLKKFNFIYNFE